MQSDGELLALARQTRDNRAQSLTLALRIGRPLADHNTTQGGPGLANEAWLAQREAARTTAWLTGLRPAHSARLTINSSGLILWCIIVTIYPNLVCRKHGFHRIY